MGRKAGPPPVEPPESLERVQERLWHALPSVVALRTAESKEPEKPPAGDEEPPAEDPIATARVPFAELQQAAACLFAACHRNPAAADVADGVAALVGPAEGDDDGRTFGRAEVAQLLLDAAAQWMEWADKEQGWRAVSERQLASVLKNLVDCITFDTPPGALLPQARVLTARSEIAHTKLLVTPFEAFVELKTPPEFPGIYDTLWSLLRTSPEEEFISEVSFIAFFRWFYLRVFSNATEASAGVAAGAVWNDFLDVRGRMGQRQFVAACRHMCRLYAQRDDVACLESFYHATADAAAPGADFFAHRALSLNRILANPDDLFVSEDLDAARREAALVAPEHSANRIVVCGRRGVGKSAVAAVVAQRLGCVDLSVETLAADAAAASDRDPIGAQLRVHVAENTAVPLALRAALVRRRLAADDITHRGYVFSDFPICPTGDVPDDVRAFFEACGIFDLALPTAIAHVSCDDESLFAERRAAAARAAAALTAREDERRAAVAASAAREAHVAALRAAVQLGAALPPPAAAATPPPAAAPSPSPPPLSEAEAEAERVRAAAAAAAEELARLGEGDGRVSRGDDEAANKADEEAAAERQRARQEERQAWEAEAFMLALRRLIREAPESESEVVPTALAPLDAIDARLRPLGRYATLDCTSTPEEAAAYIVETLQLQPCVLPRNLASAEEERKNGEAGLGSGDDGSGTKNDSSALLEREGEKAKGIEENALEMGAISSDVWKRYCPVTFADCRVLVEGSALYGSVYRQRFYCMASAECLARFLADPPRYIRATPLNGVPVLLLSTIDTREDPSLLSSEFVDALLAGIFEKLKLTSYSFSDFSAAWDQHRDLRERRAQALQERELYETAERPLRAERLRKRLVAEMKAMKKRKNQTPAPKKNQQKGKVEEETPDEEERYTGWDVPSDIPKTTALRIQERVSASIERRRTFVPILVNAIEPDFSREAFDLLLAEGVLPETVVVLDYAKPQADDAEEPDDEPGEEEGESGARPETAENTDEPINEGQDEGMAEDAKKVKPKRLPPMPHIAVIKEIERRIAEADEEKRDPKDDENQVERPHRFDIRRFTVNDKTSELLLGEILQSISPAMPQIEEGVVDEALGEDDDVSNEDEEELYGENDEDNDGVVGPGALAVADPAVQPGKRFLNQFGSRLQYCPVTFNEKGLLVQGRNEHCVKYRQQLYVFATEEAQAKFERHPLRYLENPAPYVPPRIWVVGYSSSGKKTLMRQLGKVYNIPCFVYDREFFERCIEAARTPGGATVKKIKIPEISDECEDLVLAEKVLKEVRDFAKEQERQLELREAAEAEMERRRLAEERADEEEEEEEPEEVDEEAEALLQEQLEFEPEADEDRQLRLTEAYLQIASHVTRLEPFASRGYIMMCPPFSDGDLEVLFAAGGVPEVALQINLTAENYRVRNRHAPSTKAFSQVEFSMLPQHLMSDGDLQRNRRAERALHKWRRRHIGADDPDSDVDEGSANDNVNGANDDTTGEADLGVDDQSLDAEQAVEQEAIAEFADSIAERLVPIITLNGDLSKQAVYRAANRKLFKVLEHRRSLLHIAEVCRYEDALRMLERGEVTLSYFGHTDPVALYDARSGVRRDCKWCPDGVLPSPEKDPNAAVSGPAAITEDGSGGSVEKKTRAQGGGSIRGEAEDEENEEEELEEPDEEAPRSSLRGTTGMADDAANREAEDEDEEMSEYGSEEMDEARGAIERARRRERLRHYPRAALFCGRFYFFDTDAALSRFLRDPLLFVLAPPPPPPPPARAVVSVVDARAEAKRRGLAEHVALNLRCPLVSLPKLLAWAAVREPLLFSLARRAIDAALRAGAASGDGDGDGDMGALIGNLLAHRLAGADVRRRGAVLLNLPRTAEQYHCLLRAGVRIDKVADFENESSVCAAAVQAMRATAVVDAPAQEPRRTYAALGALTGCIDEFVAKEGSAALCRTRGIPISIENTYCAAAHVEAHLSPYGWFCPYSWVCFEELVDQRESQKYGAEYLGVFYFFSSAAFLARFLATPAEVTEAPGLRPVPKVVPSRIPFTEGMVFELLGCCPVTLFDTRENKGLRGVIEPIAREGDRTCIVQYEDKNYALCDEIMLDRFMRCPWQYVAGAALPPSRKQPLQAPATTTSIDEEEYIRRILYDPVAYALVAVMNDRPKYPGLSVEESALKFVALHMKCHNEKNTAIRSQQYKKNFATFRKRAVLYKSMTEEFEDVCGVVSSELCDEWEKAVSKEDISTFIHLN